MIKTTRLLLPFTHGVEMDALEAAVLLAASHHATLVPLSLVPAPLANGKGIRLEHIQQSKDFLEATQHKALRYHVPLERLEAFTGDAMQGIAVLVQQMTCDGMILALRGRKGSLLSAEMIEQLLAMRPCPLYLLYLPSKEPSLVSGWREHLFNLLPRYRRLVEKGLNTQLSPTPGERGFQQDVVLSGYIVGSPECEQ